MATIQKFEDLVCWQKSRELANRDFDLKRQMRRAAISPMSNVAEGFDRGTRAEFVDALFIAKGEVGEVRAQLYIAYDRRYIDISKFRNGLQLTDECSRLIQSFAEKVKGGSRRGMQFKRIVKPDPFDAILKQHAPEAWARFHPEG